MRVTFSSVLFFVFAFFLRYIYRMSNHIHMLHVYPCLCECEGIIFLIFSIETRQTT